MQLVQRKATENDYPQLQKIWRDSVRETHSFLKEVDFLEIEEQLINYFQQVSLKVWLQSQEEIVGFSGTHGEHLEMLFLDPRFFRKNYGSEILQHLIREAGVTTVDVNEENTGALAFYQKNGFQLVQRSEKDSQGKDYPILHLKLA